MNHGLASTWIRVLGFVQVLLLALLTIACTNTSIPIEQNVLLSELEDKASNSDLWPNNSEQVGEFIEDLGRLIRGMSALEESTYFPQLAELRWMAIGFDALHQNPAGTENDEMGESPYSLAIQLRAIAEEKPEFIDSNFEASLSALEERLWAHAKMLEDTDIDHRLIQARQFLTSGSMENLNDDAPMFEHLDFLSYYEDFRPDRREEISKTREKLENRLSALELEALDKRRRDYQAWALEMIWAFEQKVEDIQQDEGFRFSNPIPDNWTWEEEEYQEIQGAMINHLVPIDQTVLDLPVMRRFHSSFDIAWKILDGQDERKAQNCVAIASTLISKRTSDNGSVFDLQFDRLDRSEQWRERKCAQ